MAKNKGKAEIRKQHEKKSGSVLHAQMSSYFSGPLPPPEIFKEYENILPGSAERILKMAEDQSSHRRQLESTVITGEQKRANRGLNYGFIIGMTVIVGGLVLVFMDKSTEGFASIILGLVTLVGVFIYGDKSKKEDLGGKDKKLKDRVEELEKRLGKENVIDGSTLE